VGIFRSLLFVPAHRENMVAKAHTHRADVIVLDLEESVPASEKAAARECAARHVAELRGSGAQVYARINDAESGILRDDLMTVVSKDLTGVVLPKADSPQDVRDMDVLLREAEMANGVRPGDVGVITMIESPRGLLRCEEIVEATDRIVGLALGAYDYTNELGVPRTREGTAIAYVRYQIATIAAAYGVIAIDTPYADIQDEEGLAAETKFVKAVGFKAKFAVHPKQVAAINRIFAPNEAELAEAKQIIEEFDAGVSAGRGAVSVGGRMVDGPIAARARRLIELADQIAGRE
jgi:citrate lyase subunit beta / citryl-CoA lyase